MHLLITHGPLEYQIKTLRKQKPREGIWFVQGHWSENPPCNSQNNTLYHSWLPLTQSPSPGATACVSCLPCIPGPQATWDLGNHISHFHYYPTSIVSWPWSLLALAMGNMCSFPCRVWLHLSSNKRDMLQKICTLLDLWALPLGWWPWVSSSPVNQSQEPNYMIF